MTTQSGDNLEQELKKLANSMMPIIAPIICLQIMHSIRLFGVEWEAKKELGRPLTDLERAYCREEIEKRQVLDWMKLAADLYARQSRDMEVIRRIIQRQSL